MPAYELGEHVEELAQELGVVIIPPWVGSFADADEFPAGAAGHLDLADGGGFPVIWVSEEPTSAEAYLVALHELGHHATEARDCTCTAWCIPQGLEGDQVCQLAYSVEQAAWQWAEEHSRLHITPRLREFIERRLDSYR